MVGRSWGGLVLGTAGLLCYLFLNLPDAAAKPKPKGESPEEAAASECALSLASEEPIGEFDKFYQIHQLEELVSPDPTINLAARFPTIVMNAHQKGWAVAKHFGSHEILDPDYRIERYTVWHVLSTPIGKKGVRLIGQYAAGNELIGNLREAASGASPAKVTNLNGPAGTGKTEVLKIFHLRRAHISRDTERFYEFRFRWKNLREIPALMALQDPTQANQPFYHQMGRTPIVLIPESLQEKVARIASPAVHELTGFGPQPFTIKDRHSEQIISDIIRYKFPKAAPTEKQYIETLSHFVEIERYAVDPNQPPIFIRNQGRDVEWENLFMSENMITKAVYGAENPLSYNYNGLILRGDGWFIGADEFFRNTIPLRDTFLDIAQNRVVQRGGAPAESVDAFVIFADNDESIAKAREESAANAQIDRGIKVPMRMPINPTETAKIALAMAMQEWGAHKFTMEKLGPNSPGREPLDLDSVYPEPTATGKLEGPDGRYAIFVKLGSGAEVLIAPRSLYLIGLTAAATRLVTDPAALVKHLKEFDILKSGANEYTDPITRLQILMNKLPTSEAIRTELTKVKWLLKEGSEGLSPRSVQTWLLRALKMAEQNDATLTPAVVAAAFEKSLDDEKINFKNNDFRAKWVRLHDLVKSGLLLPELVSDVLNLLSQKVDLENLYKEIEADIIALSQNPDATHREDAGQQLIAINRKRWSQLKGVYARINGRAMEPGEVVNFRLRPAHSDGDRHPGLLEAIKTWRYESELDALALDNYLNYFHTANGTDDVRRAAERAKADMQSHGYNLRALLEAMSMSRDLLHEQELRRQDGF